MSEDHADQLAGWLAAHKPPDLRSAFAAPLFEWVCTDPRHHPEVLTWTTQWDPSDRTWRTGGSYEWVMRGRDADGEPVRTWPARRNRPGAHLDPRERRSERVGDTFILRCPHGRCGEVKVRVGNLQRACEFLAQAGPEFARPKRDRPGASQVTLATLRAILNPRFRPKA